ncbi:MAG TPA: nicotinamide riboside transporter PnuC [Myxococcota bacterium]|nr:nicotinamide riboside transporter PnuC [Myxococcota bacterium]
MDPVAFVVAGSPVTWTELVGDLTGLVCVYLVARANVWNWPVGIANTVLFFFVFLRSRLYGDALLQVVFTALGVYGWWTWTRGGEPGDELPVRRATPAERAACLALSLAGTAAAALVLARKTDSPVPLWDASVLVLSLVATWAQAQKLVESWWLWITVDVISVPLYVKRGLYPTALLYALFLALCVLGLREWLRLLREQRATAELAA